MKVRERSWKVFGMEKIKYNIKLGLRIKLHEKIIILIFEDQIICYEIVFKLSIFIKYVK